MAQAVAGMGSSSSQKVTTTSRGSRGRGGYNVQYGSLIGVDNPNLRGAEEISKLYGGILYDRDKIQSIFQDATAQKYNQLRKDAQQVSNKYYDRLSAQGNQMQQTLMQDRAASTRNGTSQGMRQANALASMLGLSQQTSQDNLALAEEEWGLANKQRTEEAQNVKDALQYSNEVKLGIGALSSNIYASDVQKYAAQLGYNAQIQAANTAASAQMAAIHASRSGGGGSSSLFGMDTLMNTGLSLWLNGNVEQGQAMIQTAAGKMLGES